MSTFNFNGNVGIQTQNPSYTLDVNGNINFTNELYKNGVLVSTVGLPTGTNYGDYLYYNGTGWITGSSNVNIGINAGQISQQSQAVAIGVYAGNDRQGSSSVAIGDSSGQTSQQSLCIAIGAGSGQTNQGTGSDSAIAIGNMAGHSEQQGNAIAIGQNAGQMNQQVYCIAIGYEAGKTDQGITTDPTEGQAIAIGYRSGNYIQGDRSIAIGDHSGQSLQHDLSIAIGSYASQTNQGTGSVSIGPYAGYADQGEYSIAIGYQAGYSAQSNKSIILNASGNILNASTGGMYVDPIRQFTSSTNATVLTQNDNKEIVSVPLSSIVNSSIIVVGGYNGVTPNRLAYSLDNGLQWNLSTSGGDIINQVYSIAYNGSRWVSVGYNGDPNNTIVYSDDGINWITASNPGTIFTDHVYGVSFGQNKWIAAGIPNVNMLAYSTDGITWTGSPSSNDVFTYGLCSAYDGKGMWVSGGGGTYALGYSTNGMNWTGTPSNIGSGFGVGLYACNSVAYNGRIWIAAGTTSSDLTNYSFLYSSTDGINWSPIISAQNLFLQNDGIVNGAKSICWNGYMWVVGGAAIGGDYPTIYYSYDGLVWNQVISSSTDMYPICYNICWNSNEWIAVGEGVHRILRSSDGINWTPSINGDSTITDVIYCCASQSILPNITTIHSTFVGSDLIPNQNNVFSLGMTGAIWKDLYVGTGSIYIGDVTLSNQSNSLNVNKPISSNYSNSIILSNYTTGSNIVISGGSEGVPYPLIINVDTNMYSYSYVELSSIVFSDFSYSNMNYSCHILIEAPNGQTCWLINYPDSYESVSGAQIRFVDSINAPLILGPISTGTYRPTSTNNTYVMPSPSPSSTNTSFIPLTTSNINGEWKIWAYDDDLDAVYSGGYIGNVTLNFTLYQCNNLPTTAISNALINNISVSTGSFLNLTVNNSLFSSNIQSTTSTFSTLNSTNANLTTLSAQNTTSKTLNVTQTLTESPNGFIIVGEGGGSIGRSSNGNWWDSYSVFSTGGYGIAWNGLYNTPLYVAVGDGDLTTMAYSTNGTDWTSLGNTIFVKGRAVAFNGSMWVAVGEGVTSNINYSYDGLSWYPIQYDYTTPLFTDGIGLCVSYIKNKWWVGSNDSTNTLLSSDNGIYWIGEGNFTFPGRCNCFAYNGYDLAIAGGNDGVYSKLATFTPLNGSWTDITSSIISIIDMTVNGSCWNGKQFFIVGQSSFPTKGATSVDGIHWTGNTLGGLVDTNATCVSYKNSNTSYFVGGAGTSTIIYSNDNGNNWGAAATPAFSTITNSIISVNINDFTSGYSTFTNITSSTISSSLFNVDYLNCNNHITTKGPLTTSITTSLGYISNLSLTGTDTAGTYSFRCQGTATPNDSYVTIGFSTLYTNNPIVIITPANIGAGDFIQESSYYISSNTSSFSMNCANDLPNNSAIYNCTFNYIVIGV